MVARDAPPVRESLKDDCIKAASNSIVLFLFIYLFFLDAISYYCVETFESQLLQSFYYNKYIFDLPIRIQMRVTCLFLLY
jgi:hypothetical protein